MSEHTKEPVSVQGREAQLAHFARRDAMQTFCAGFDTASLTGSSLSEVVEALRSLANEAGGSAEAFGPEMRGVIGNTNYQCLVERVKEADALLSRLQPKT